MDDIKWFVGLLLIMGMLWISGWHRAIPSTVITATTTPKTAVTVSPKKPAGTVQNGSAVQILPKPAAGKPAATGTAPVPASNPYTSALRGKLSIISVHRGTKVNEEYVTIQAAPKNASDIIISGLSLRSGVTLISQKIPGGWKLPYPNANGEADLVALQPGTRAYIVSGRSPNGLSFQQNTCTGYFEQKLNFTPPLPLQCPRPIDEPLPLPPNTLSDTCLDYITELRGCMVSPSKVPTNLVADGSCQAFIFNRINYNQCVIDHKDDKNFYRGEWHLYLGRDTSPWRSRREIVQLVDGDGKIIDERSY